MSDNELFILIMLFVLIIVGFIWFKPENDSDYKFGNNLEYKSEKLEDTLEYNFNLFSPIKKLMNGDFGLPVTYWVFGVVATNTLGFVITLILESTNLLTYLLIAIFAIFYYVIILVGVWRASNKYKGPKIWENLAKTAVVLSIVYTILYALSLAVVET